MSCVALVLATDVVDDIHIRGFELPVLGALEIDASNGLGITVRIAAHP